MMQSHRQPGQFSWRWQYTAGLTVLGASLLAVVAILTLVFDWPLKGDAYQPTSVDYTSPGPVQVLASAEELWVFFEVYHIHKDPFGKPWKVGSDVRMSRLLDNSWRTDVRLDCPVRINPNVSIIMRSEGSFRLIAQQENNRRDVLVLEGNAFQRVVEDQGTRALLLGSWYELCVRADEETEKAGWRSLFRDPDPFSTIIFEGIVSDSRDLTWQGHKFVLLCSKLDGAAQLSIVEEGVPGVVLFSFDSANR